MRHLAVFTLLTASCVLAASPLEQADKEKFAEFYRDDISLRKEFPDDLDVHVMFEDLDGDGVPEAIATSRSSRHEDGSGWNIYTLKGGKWAPIRGYDQESKAVTRYSAIFARAGEVFRVVKNDGSLEFLILGENFDKLQPEGVGPLNKRRFFLDKESILQQEKVGDLERYLAYAGAHRSGLIKSMEALKVEVFPSAK